jgi:uncharacterized Rossmann fold enzyme
MDFTAWEPRYRAILEEFHFSPEAERASRDWLVRALGPGGGYAGLQAGEGDLSRILRGAQVLIVGRGAGSLPLPLFAHPTLTGPWVTIACDGATSACLARGSVPDLIVSDLDGYLPDEIEANRRGSLLLVHAHGDNLELLQDWLPLFPGPVLGSCSDAPLPPLLNVGGFADGDRALHLAEAYGARRALLAGFRERPGRSGEGAQGDLRRRKLLRSQALLRELQARGRLSVEFLDGAVRQETPVYQ